MHTYYVCEGCGHTWQAPEHPGRCEHCGHPHLDEHVTLDDAEAYSDAVVNSNRVPSGARAE